MGAAAALRAAGGAGPSLARAAGAGVHVEVLELRRLLSTAQDITGLTALRNDAAYDSIDGSGVGVAVIDSGAWAAHPDLRNNFVAFFDGVLNRFTTGPGSTNVASAVDPDGHGTHVAGTAVSTNPAVGVATRADLIAIRGLPSAADPIPQFDTVDNSLQWVLANHDRYNIKVVNMSLGVPETNFNTLPGGRRPDVFNQLEQLGITVVVASGNNYGNFAAPGSSDPGVYGTFSVANTWPDAGPTADFPIIAGSGQVDYFAGENDAAPDRIAATSQRSTMNNSVAAPGQEIFSTWNDAAKPYNRISGTSMAAPFVSGLVALMQDAAQTFGGRYLTPVEVQTVVRTTADVIIDSQVSSNFRVPVAFDQFGQVFRAGPDEPLIETGQTFQRVNALRAIKEVQRLVTGASPDPDPDPTPGPGPTPPPTSPDVNRTTGTAITVPPLDATRLFRFNGHIGTDGSVQVGEDDIDLFRVDLEAPGEISIVTAPLPGGRTFDAYLRLFNAAGTPIASSDNAGGGNQGTYPTLRSVRLAAGRYYLGVSSFNNTAYNPVNGDLAASGRSEGDYRLTVGLSNADPNGVAQGATLVDLADPQGLNPHTNRPANFLQGSVNTDPNPTDPTGPDVVIGPTDVDMLQVTAPDDGVLTIDVDALSSVYPTDGVDSFVRVFDSSLDQIAANDNADGRADSFLQVGLEAGETYYVAVTTFDNRNFNPLDPFDRVVSTNTVGRYDLYLHFDNGDADGTVYTARDGTLGSGNSEIVGFDNGRALLGASDGDKDVDFFRFTVPSGGLLDVTADSFSTDLSPAMTVWRFNAATRQITRVREAAGDDPRLIIPVTAGEQLYVSVTGSGNGDFNWYAVASGSGGDTGTYVLNAAVRPNADLPLLIDDSVQGGTPETLNAGDALFRTLGADGGLERGAADVDLYRFVAGGGGALVLRASVPGEQRTDPFLRVFDAAGNEIAFNDDASPESRDAGLTVEVTAGQTYYVGVSGSGPAARAYNPIIGAGAGDAARGDYVLAATAPGGPGPQPPPVGEVPPGSERSITFGGKERAVYTQADGDVIVLSIKGPGTGTVFFDAAAGDRADPLRVVLDGTTAKSALSVQGAAALGNVTVNGSLGTFGSRTLDLRGNLSVSGSLKKVQLGNASGGTITLGPGAPLTFAAADVSDLSLNSAAAVKSIKVNQWLDTDATPDTIAAPSVASLTVKGNFGANVSAGSVGKLSVTSDLVGSEIRAAGSIASVRAGGMRDSKVSAGVRPDLAGLPAAAADFTDGNAQIKAVSIKGKSPSAFVNSYLSAPVLGKVTLGGLTPANGGAPMGLAARRIASVKATGAGGPLSLARLDDPADSTAMEDFLVRLL